jgi:hypothetical protein
VHCCTLCIHRLMFRDSLTIIVGLFKRAAAAAIYKHLRDKSHGNFCVVYRTGRHRHQESSTRSGTPSVFPTGTDHRHLYTCLLRAILISFCYPIFPFALRLHRNPYLITVIGYFLRVKKYVHTWTNEWGVGGGGSVEMYCGPYSAGVLHFVSDQIQNLQNCFTTLNKNDQ